MASEAESERELLRERETLEMESDQSIPDPSHTSGTPKLRTCARWAQSIRPFPRSNSIAQIAFLSLLILAPMLLFPAILLCIIFSHRFLPNDEFEQNVSEIGTMWSSASSSVIYVDFSSTILVFVASWASTVALSLVPIVMMLWSYIAARDILRCSEPAASTSLPSVHEFGLLISLLGGSISPLGRWLQYHRKGRSIQRSRVRSLTYSALITSGAIILSLLIQAADTWLHIMTKATPMQMNRITTPTWSAGRTLAASCLNDVVTDSALPCSLKPFPQNDPSGKVVNKTYLADPGAGYETLANVSEKHRVYLAMSSYLVNETAKTALLGPSVLRSNVSYRAHTFGVSTTCQAIAQECEVASNVSAVLYDCSESEAQIVLKGDLLQSSWNMVFYNSSDRRLVEGLHKDSGNPLYWALASSLDIERPASLDDKPQDVFSMTPGSFATIFSCNSTVWDIIYQWNTFGISIDSQTPANTSVANTFFQPVHPDAHLATQQLQSDLRLAAVKAANTSEFAALFATSFSKVAVALPAGQLDVRLTDREVVTYEKIVSAVPMAPLWTLIALCVLYAAMGVALAVMALKATSIDPVIREVRAQLDIQGVVAAAFDKTSEPRGLTEGREGPEGDDHRKRVRRVGFDREAGVCCPYVTMADPTYVKPTKR